MPRVRPRKPIDVCVNPTEREQIEAIARQVRMPVGRYLREVGLGYQPKSVMDEGTLLELMRLRADLGRVGGLLKLWLADRPGAGMPKVEVARLFREIQKLKGDTESAVGAVLALLESK